jgi:methionyl-tRNA formyltransferase
MTEATSATDKNGIATTPRRRIVFMGTPDFAAVALQALIAASESMSHQIVAVYSQPPRPAGRGHQVQQSPVHILAESQRLPVLTPVSLRSAESQEAFAAHQADVAVVVAYGLLLPPAILALPRFGCLNIHASLLPRWRGAAPIQRAILAGDKETGVTIMQMDAGLDTGATLLREATPIRADDTGATLHDRLADIGGRLIVAALKKLPLAATPQPADGVVYAAKLSRDDGRLDWTKPAADLERQVRAFDPWPGAWFEYRGERIKVLAANATAASGTPGTVIDVAPAIACGGGALQLRRLQRPGKGPLDAADFLRGFPLPAGTKL